VPWWIDDGVNSFEFKAHAIDVFRMSLFGCRLLLRIGVINPDAANATRVKGDLDIIENFSRKRIQPSCRASSFKDIKVGDGRAKP
jgi:hypothetical protein